MANHPHDRTRLLYTGWLLIFLLALYAHTTQKLGVDYRHWFPPFEKKQFVSNELRHLGGENRNIAWNIVHGKGFSNPYLFESGPTAWMPPAYPILLAGLISLFGKDFDLIGSIVVLFHLFVLMLVWRWIIEIVQPQSRRQSFVLLLVLGMFLTTHLHYCFLYTHDFILAFLAAAALCRFSPLNRTSSTWKYWILWGAIGGFAILSAPALMLSWLFLTMMVLRRHFQGIAISLLCCGLILTPWTMRNWLVFGKLIPVKSNAPYELYQSLKYTDTGIIKTFISHPGSSGPELVEYLELGEAAYIDRKTIQAWQMIKDDPGRYLKHCGNRLWALTVVASPEMRDPPSYVVPIWYCRMIYPLPAVAILVWLVTWRWRPLPGFVTPFLVYLGYCLPYVAISYYERYEYPLNPMKILMVYFAARHLCCRTPQTSETGKVSACL